MDLNGCGLSRLWPWTSMAPWPLLWKVIVVVFRARPPRSCQWASVAVEAMDLHCRSWPWRSIAGHGHGDQGPPWLWPSTALAMDLHGYHVVEVLHGFFFFFSVINQMTLQTMWGPHKQPSINNLTENLIEVSIYKCTKHGYQIY